VISSLFAYFVDHISINCTLHYCIIHLYCAAVLGCELGCEENNDADYGSIFECCHFGFVFSIFSYGLNRTGFMHRDYSLAGIITRKGFSYSKGITRPLGVNIPLED
jgi:hypothetical protein